MHMQHKAGTSDEYKRFKAECCEETGILQEESLSNFKVFDPREMPLEHSHLATYGNCDVKSSKRR